MSDIAFHADPAVQAQALERLRRHIASGTFVYFPAWEDGNANVIGAVVEADDTPGYAERTGYPIAMAEALPSILNAIQPRDAAARFAEAWLERTPVGAELGTIPSRLILDLLERPALCALTTAHPALEQVRQDVVALHRRAVAGDMPDRKGWKAVRLASVEATDGLPEGGLERRAGSVVEAAAWPGSMRTVVRDTLGAYGALELGQRLAEMGWTEEEESRAFHIRKQAEEDGFLAELFGLDRMYAVLEAKDPALGIRFRMRCDCMEQTSVLYRSFGETAIAMMERMPRATGATDPAQGTERT